MTINASEPSKELTGPVPTVPAAVEPDVDADVMSDPALDDQVGSDWADEGGAVPAGPATAAPAPEHGRASS